MNWILLFPVLTCNNIKLANAHKYDRNMFVTDISPIVYKLNDVIGFNI